MKIGQNKIQKKIKIANEIIKDCFWGDYNILTEDILNIVNNGSQREKNFLFNKIIRNSRRATILLKIFDKKDLIELLNSFKVKNFNKFFIEKKLIALQKNLLNMDREIKELKWI